jgi:hypothetical protein
LDQIELENISIKLALNMEKEFNQTWEPKIMELFSLMLINKIVLMP